VIKGWSSVCCGDTLTVSKVDTESQPDARRPRKLRVTRERLREWVWCDATTFHKHRVARPRVTRSLTYIPLQVSFREPQVCQIVHLMRTSTQSVARRIRPFTMLLAALQFHVLGQTVTPPTDQIQGLDGPQKRVIPSPSAA
jgi:hypothetical protein